jgi:hypothetical protein
VCPVTEQEEPEEVWYERLQDAAENALEAEDVEMNQVREVVFLARKRNPIHEFRAKLKPSRD